MKASSPKKKLPDNSGSFFVAYLTEKTRGKTENPRGEGWRNPEEKRTGKNVKEGREKSHKGKQEILEMKGWENQRRKDKLPRKKKKEKT